MAGAGGGTRTHKTVRPADFKSAASANSATPAPEQQNAQAPVRVLSRKFRFGGDDRIRTGDGGFADPCLTTWLRRPKIASPASTRSWCRGGDLNPYARRHGPLKTACLPVPPPRPKSNRQAGDARSEMLSPTADTRWQEWRDSNPRPAVLETAALPTELHSSDITWSIAAVFQGRQAQAACAHIYRRPAAAAHLPVAASTMGLRNVLSFQPRSSPSPSRTATMSRLGMTYVRFVAKPKAMKASFGTSGKSSSHQ